MNASNPRVFISRVATKTPEEENSREREREELLSQLKKPVFLFYHMSAYEFS